jgi:hypothetical protein
MLCIVLAAPASADEVALPPSTATVEFPAGQSSVVLPAHEDRGKFIVRANIGGRGIDFVLDSGAGGIPLEDGAAKDLGLVPSGAFTDSVNAGSYRSLLLNVPLITVGPIKIQNVRAESVPRIQEIGPKGEYHAVGLLGYDFIRSVVLKLDYDSGILTAYDPKTFVPPQGPGEFDLDLNLSERVPLVSVTVDGIQSDRFLIDTGGAATMLLFGKFTSANKTAIVDEGGGGALRNVRLSGIGGDILTKPLQVKSVQLGSVTFTDLLTYSVDGSQYTWGADGNLGLDILHFFDVYLDYAHGKAYFVVNGSGRNVRS